MDINLPHAYEHSKQADIHTEFKKTTGEAILVSVGVSAPEAVAYIASQRFVAGIPRCRPEQDPAYGRIT